MIKKVKLLCVMLSKMSVYARNLNNRRYRIIEGDELLEKYNKN